MAGEEVTAGKSSPAELFRRRQRGQHGRPSPVRVNSFYSYTGSLTTPGCTEGVLWSVLAAGQASGAAVTRFHGLIAQFPNYNGYPNNNRPLQPLNGTGHQAAPWQNAGLTDKQQMWRPAPAQPRAAPAPDSTLSRDPCLQSTLTGPRIIVPGRSSSSVRLVSSSLPA